MVSSREGGRAATGFTPLDILATGMVTPVGLTTAASAAAVRAGIARLSESYIYGKQGEPLVMGLVRDEYLEPLTSTLRPQVGLIGRQERMLRLAAPALRQACHRWELLYPPPLLLALPGPGPAGTQGVGSSLLRQLADQARVSLDLGNSRIIQKGRAGGLLALRQAQELIREQRVPYVLVGGVDTYLDRVLLAQLDGEDRLRQKGPSDGFVPGEAAAFLLLRPVSAAKGSHMEPIARITAMGEGRETGHWSSAEPYLGEGLAEAFRDLFGRLPEGAPKVGCVYAGLNGERFWSKEWGTAYLRSSERFEGALRLEHPIENIGDPGAALGPCLTALAAVTVCQGHRSSPCLVWCSSDGEERAVVLVERVVNERKSGTKTSDQGSV
jgi:3-oxoacyl-[acyl-carrier-protein] synthase-1